MKKRLLMAASLVGLAGLAAVLVALARAKPPLLSPVKTVTVAVKHNEVQSFDARYELEVGRPVYIHDTHYWIRLDDFASDFTIDKKTKEVITRSQKLKNPAAKVTLGFMDKTVYTQWIFREEEARHEIKSPGFIFTIARIRQP